MLATLKFVQGAVSKKDFVPAMSHFNINEGRITAFNGLFSIGAPISCNINCNPNAETFIKAINKCKSATQLSLTPTGKLSIKSGKFRALVECLPEEFPKFEPEGAIVNIDGGTLYQTLSTLYNFTGDDATRPWSNGVLFSGQSAYATNNIILVEKWLGSTFPIAVNIPRQAIREVLRVKESPINIQIADRSVTFNYEGDRWIKTQQLDMGWPNVNAILNQPGTMQAIDEALFGAVEHVKDFSDNLNAVYFKDGYISTSKVDGDGATFELESSPGKGCYSSDMLLKLKGVAQTIDWTAYPKPCPFYGDRLRGIIIGLRGE